MDPNSSLKRELIKPQNAAEPAIDKESRLNEEQKQEGGFYYVEASEYQDYDDLEKGKNNDWDDCYYQEPKEIQNPNPSIPPPSQVKSIKSNLEQLIDDQFDKEKLDRMYKFPASYKEAMIHNQASRFGFTTTKIKRDQEEQKQLKDILASFIKNKINNGKHLNKEQLQQEQMQKKLKKYEKVPVCPCCENYISNVELPLCYPTESSKPKNGEPKFLLQTGVSMYFAFIKAVIIYLIIRMLIFDSANIYFSISGHYCHSVSKESDNCSYTTISGYNLNHLEDTQALNRLDYCSLGLTIISIIYFIWYRKKQARMINWLDRNDKSQQDFSLLIEDIPLFIYQNNSLDKDDKDYKKMLKKDVKYDYELLLKQTLQQIIRIWLREVVNSNGNYNMDDIETHFYKYVYLRKIADQKDEAEERKKNPNKRKILKEQLLTDQDIQKYVQQIIVNKRRIVTSVTLCYDLTQLETMNKIRNQLVQEYIQQNQDKVINANTPEFKNNKFLEHIPNQIDLLNQEYTNLCNNLAKDYSPSFSLSHFTGKAIVSFQYKHYRDAILREYEQNESFVRLNNINLKISNINKPEDIYWYNMKVSDSDRSRYIFYSSSILFMLLILSFGSLVGLQYWQSHTQLPVNSTKPLDKLKSSLFSMGMAILTNIINFILSYSIQLLADMQKHKTKSERLNSLIIKIIVTQTINTSFIYFILYLIAPKNPLGKTGLVKNVFDLVLVSGFISVSLQIFPPSYLYTKLRNQYKYQGKQQINTFQVRLNQILQQPEFNFAVMYAFYIVFTFVVAFYGFLTPMATPVLIAIFAIQYWVDKYNLFKRYSCPVDFGADLIKKIFNMFEVSLLISVVGHFIWDLKLHKDQTPEFRVLGIANLTIAALFVIFELFAPDRLKRKIFPFQRDQSDPYSYERYQREDAFKKTFFRENPATSCLKQTKLSVGKQKKSAKADEDLVHEAPDPQFIPDHDRIFQKFLNLQQKRKILERYNAFDEQYYQNLDNDEWDEADAQERFHEQERAKKKVEKDGYLGNQGPKKL